MGLSVLHDLIVDEEIYISIYTKNFPNNEIREDSWSELTVIFQILPMFSGIDCFYFNEVSVN